MFGMLRSDVLVKLELLDNKHVQDIVHQVTAKHGHYVLMSVFYIPAEETHVISHRLPQ